MWKLLEIGSRILAGVGSESSADGLQISNHDIRTNSDAGFSGYNPRLLLSQPDYDDFQSRCNPSLLKAQPSHDLKANPDLFDASESCTNEDSEWEGWEDFDRSPDIEANPDAESIRNLPESSPDRDVAPKNKPVGGDARPGHDIKANSDGESVRNLFEPSLYCNAAPKNKPVGGDASASFPDAANNNLLFPIVGLALASSLINSEREDLDRGPDIKANPDVESFQNRDAAPKNKPVGDDASASCTNAANNNALKLKLGFAFVINHNTFEDSKLVERSGSNFDVQKIEKVLKRFQIPFHTVPNGTLADVKRTKHRLANFNFKDYASVILFIMSHGYEKDMLAAKDGKYWLFRDVLFPMLRNKSLEGKPKLLFIQACKGSTNLVLSTDSIIEPPNRVPDKILQFSSCVEGYVSLRHTHGSIFIQTLCEKIEEFGDTKDIRDICNKVIDAVSWELAGMQIPMIHTNITTPFVFGHYSA